MGGSARKYATTDLVFLASQHRGYLVDYCDTTAPPPGNYEYAASTCAVENERISGMAWIR